MNYILGKKIAPFKRTPLKTNQMMKHLYNVLMVIAISQVFIHYYLYSFGYAVKVLLIILTAILTSKETEIFYFTHFQNKTREEAKSLVKNSYPQITGLIFALIIPVGTPLWVVIFGLFIGLFISKLMYGGFSYNVFNPAIVTRVFVVFAWGGLLTIGYANSFDNNLLNLIFENNLINNTLGILSKNQVSIDTIAAATQQLGGIANYSSNSYPSIFKLLFGLTPGAIGEGFSILIILGGVYLIIKRVIDWVIPTTIICSVILMVLGVSLINDASLNYVLVHLFSNGLLFGAFFVATDPVTSPKTRYGKIVYSIIIAIITVSIRTLGNYPEGFMFAILIINMFVPLINTKTFGDYKKSHYYFLIGLILFSMVTTNFIAGQLKTESGSAQVESGDIYA